MWRHKYFTVEKYGQTLYAEETLILALTKGEGGGGWVNPLKTFAIII